MAKHKYKRRRDPGRHRAGAAGAAFVRVDNPFSALPEGEFTAALIAAGAAAERDFETNLKTLEDLLRTVNVLDLLSVLTFHGLFTGVMQSGRTKKRDELTVISQHHVELAQALALSSSFALLEGVFYSCHHEVRYAGGGLRDGNSREKAANTPPQPARLRNSTIGARYFSTRLLGDGRVRIFSRQLTRRSVVSRSAKDGSRLRRYQGRSGNWR
jgi:hypothetical protein